VVDLTINNDNINGSYYYTKSGIPLELNGKINKDGVFAMTERNEKGKMTGNFSGQIDAEHKIMGLWTSGTTGLTINLEENYENAVAVEFVSGNAENCNLKGTIYENDEYCKSFCA